MNPAAIEKFKPCSKHTEIGEIPVEWKVVRLGDESITVIRGNKTINGFEKVAFIPMDFISDSRIFIKYEMRLKNDVKSFTYCERGDLLLAKITPSLENGKQGIVPDSIPNGFGLATTEVFPISCKGIDRLFLFYILKFPKFRNKIISSMIGTTGRQRASKKSVENLQIPLPPLPEQRRIAEVLGTVDSAIQKVGGAIESTERLKKGLMQRLLTRGIGHERFKESEVGRVPEEWEVKTLISAVGEKKDLIVAGPFGSNLKVEDYRNEGIPIIRLQNIEYGRFVNKDIKYMSPEKARELNYHSFVKGDIVLAKLGDPIGKTCIVPDFLERGIVVADVVRIRIDEQLLNKKYIMYVLNSFYAFNQLTRGVIGTTRPRVNLDQVRDLLVPLPPLSEQRRIAEILSTADRKLELERRRKEKLERIKKGLMNELLTGRKRVKI